MMRALILGGTSEARRLCEAVAGNAEIEAVLSLAGRTKAPAQQAIATRVGGFGGADGLIAYLRAEKMTRVIDATHPFAARMSQNAVAACAALGLPLLVYTRPPWRPQPGDDWLSAADNRAAALALGEAPRRVFLTTGRLGLADFAVAPQHFYLIRSIDDPEEAAADLPHRELLLARGPFSVEAEMELMRSRRIDVLVSKNSGGAAMEAKFAAARSLGLPVVMIERPVGGGAQTTHDLAAALAFLRGGRHEAGAERGV